MTNNFAGHLQIGTNFSDRSTSTEDTIISDSSIHYPILDKSSMSLYTTYDSDLITASNFRLTKPVGFIGTDVDSFFGQDSSIDCVSDVGRTNETH